MEIQTDNIKQFLILIITFYGFLLSALISIGQLIADAKSIKNWLLLGLFFVFSLFQIHYIFFEMELLNDYDELMDEEEVFIDENISLPRLAQQLEISSHQLSQFLNEKKQD